MGVLSLHNSAETKAILNAVEALGHEPVWIREENLVASIEEGRPRVTPEVDVLVNRLLVTKSDQPLEDLQLAALYEETTPVVNPSWAVRNAVHKYCAARRLAAADLPVPDAFFARSPRTFERWREHLPGRAVHKRTIGTNGRGMSRVSHADAVNARITADPAFLQEYLDPGADRPFDVRAYVVGDRVVGAMRRYAPDDEWRTNVALGGEVEDATGDLGPRLRRLATRATDVLGLDCSGVDLVRLDGDWYVLEVNATAGFKGLFSATGTSPAPHIARLAVERYGGGVDDARVEDLQAHLDDSVPGCKPPLEQDDSGDVVGYTTRVRVAGTTAVEAVVAKSDTGASRTCIDADLAGRIGAGPVAGTTQVRVGSRVDPVTRPLVDVDLRVNGAWRTVTASVADRSAQTHPVLLGRDVLGGYAVAVDRRVEE